MWHELIAPHGIPQTPQLWSHSPGTTDVTISQVAAGEAGLTSVTGLLLARAAQPVSARRDHTGRTSGRAVTQGTRPARLPQIRTRVGVGHDEPDAPTGQVSRRVVGLKWTVGGGQASLHLSDKHLPLPPGDHNPLLFTPETPDYLPPPALPGGHTRADTVPTCGLTSPQAEPALGAPTPRHHRQARSFRSARRWCRPHAHERLDSRSGTAPGLSTRREALGLRIVRHTRAVRGAPAPHWDQTAEWLCKSPMR